MLEDERALIVSRIDIVDYAFISIDMDLTVKKSIEEISKKYLGHELFFANGVIKTTIQYRSMKFVKN